MALISSAVTPDEKAPASDGDGLNQRLHKRPLAVYVGVCLGALGLDLITKWIVMHTMLLYQSVPIVGELIKLTYVKNTGAAFSLLANYDSPWRLVLFISVAVAAVSVLTLVAAKEKVRGIGLMIPLGLVCGGTLGNLRDRIFFDGTVIDFIEFSYKTFHFPVFNIADSAVCIGVAWLLLITFRNRPVSKQ